MALTAVSFITIGKRRGKCEKGAFKGKEVHDKEGGFLIATDYL